MQPNFLKAVNDHAYVYEHVKVHVNERLPYARGANQQPHHVGIAIGHRISTSIIDADTDSDSDTVCDELAKRKCRMEINSPKAIYRHVIVNVDVLVLVDVGGFSNQ